MSVCAVVYGLGLAYLNLEDSISIRWEAVHQFCVLTSLAEREGITQSEEDTILQKIIVS